LARYLIELGVRRETLVGIHLERSVEAVIAILAVLKAGGTFLPLDPEYPRERLEYMINDSRLEFIVTRSELSAQPLSARPRYIYLERDWARISCLDPSNPNLRVLPEQSAYVVYTSGSTGRPKGILATHRATINRISWMQAAYPYGPDEVCCARTSFNFVDSVAELFGPLLNGVPLVLLPSALILDLPQLAQTLVSHRITRITVVPSLLQVLLDAHSSGQITLPRLKYWITSGEVISNKTANQLFESDPSTHLLNLYGSSEVAGDVTWHEMSRGGVESSVPIGRPIANTQIHILDRNLQPVPAGVEGEIFVAGKNLARGYLNDPALTSTKFLPNPFASQPGTCLYRTGDYGRYLADGSILFQGRKDQQVKIRGHRIELGEIETVLEKYPDVGQAVVIPSVTADGETNLSAYLVPRNGGLPALGELRNHLKQTLPAYMLPATFTILPTMPMTANLKIDRDALPKAGQAEASTEVETEPPTDLERAIRDIWKRLLTLDRVNKDDNFFDLGGHSLQLVRLRSELRKATGHDVPVVDLFRHTTIRSLATLLAGSAEPGDGRAKYVQSASRRSA